MTVYTYIPYPVSIPCMNILHLTVSEIWQVQDFKGQCHNNKVKLRSHYDFAQLHLPTNVHTKYEQPTPYAV